MPSTYGSSGAASSFVPTTEILDASTIQNLDIKSQDFKIFLVRLQQRIKDIAVSLNGRDAGCYFQVEFINGQVYFPDPTVLADTGSGATNRQVFRKVVNFGALPNNANPKPIAHGISLDAGSTFTRIYATASDIVANKFIPLPFSAVAPADTLKLSVDGTNVIIESGGTDYSAYTICYVVLEYIKQ